MDRLDGLAAFVAVADLASFVAAARTMRASPPAVTRAIAALEARLGVRLLHRSTRSVRLTEEGGVFLQAERSSIQPRPLLVRRRGSGSQDGRDPPPQLAPLPGVAF